MHRLHPFCPASDHFQCKVIFLLLSLLLLVPVPAGAVLYRYPLQIPVPVDTWLAADLYTPDSTQAMPVIFIQTPYNKNKYIFMGMPLDTEDYAFVIMDWRGKYGSAHAAVPWPEYGQDGAIAVEWIADQPWCNGRIGTYGNSALGQIQYLTALHQPEHLVCCVPINHTLQAEYEKYYQGGVKRLEYVYSLSTWEPIPTLINLHPTKDGFWDFIYQISSYADEITVPMLVITGWWDMSPDETIRTYQDLRAVSDPAIRDEHKLLVGPWCHDTVGQLNQGEWQYPGAVGVANAEALAFLDHWLRDDPNGPYERPSAACFELGSNEFLELDTWPPEGLSPRYFYLHPEWLDETAPIVETGSDSFQYDPNNPLWTPGGRTHAGFLPSGPVDLNYLDGRQDMIVYQTDILTEPVEVAGTIQSNLYISTNRLDTDVAVLLADVFPNGRVQLLTDGIRRLRFRNGYRNPQLAIPGTVHLLEIPMQIMAVSFQPGHRIRLYVTGSNFPRFDRNLNNGGQMYHQGTTYVSMTTVYRSAEYPSALVLNAPTGEGNPTAGASVAENPVGTAIPGFCSLSTYPNPFNELATVSLTLPEAARLKLEVCNLTGQRVAELADDQYGPGEHRFSFDASRLASGLYFVRAEVTGRRDLVQKVMLVR